MKYKCIAPFSLDEYDENGFSTGEIHEVKAGEIYEIGAERIIDGEIHLNSDTSWLEISREMLEKYFVEVKE